MVKNKKAFTLVELLAVIVILAIILVIAVPSIMDTIKESRKGAFASSAKLIASSAETAYISNQTLGIEKTLTCQDVSNYTDEDYASCKIKFVDGKAKVTLEGKGKFEGMYVCGGTKDNAETTEEACTGGSVETVSFEEDDWSTIKAAVEAEDTENYHVGDTKTINLGTTLGTHTVRIANKSACPTGASALASETACGFVIEFADIITTYKMNTTSTNVGGWPASAMYSYLNVVSGKEDSGTIYNALVSAIGDIIIDTKVVSSHGSGDTSNFTTENVKVYLLSTREVWGKEGTSNTIDYDSADGNTITRQLDYYATYENADGTQGVSTSKYAGAIKDFFWWLRSAFSGDSYFFYYVTTSGGWGSGNANSTGGVSPAFRLG